MNFSQELIDHVVDFVYDDRRTLCVTRLVSRSWNISARIHFFRKLRLRIVEPIGTDSESRVHKFTRLLDILSTSPDMAYFVREVTIDISGMTIAKWKIYDPLLSNILTQLKRVTTICLRQVYWPQLSPSFRSLLTSLLKSPQLQHLNMRDCSVPSLDFLNSSYALTQLRLSHFHFSKDVDATKTIPPTINESNATTKKNFLQSLYINTKPLKPLLDALLTSSSIDFTKLRSLNLDKINKIDDIPSVCHLLQIAGSSLESLTMWAPICQLPRLYCHFSTTYYLLSISPKMQLSNYRS